MTFCPYITQMRAGIDAGTYALSDLTVEITFTLLSGKGGEEVYTFSDNKVVAATSANASNGLALLKNGNNPSYFYIVLQGDAVKSAFCPTIGSVYNVYVEIFTDYGTADQARILYGTYADLEIPAEFDGKSYYNPTAVGGAPVEPPVEPDEPEITYPITIVDTGTYKGFRKNSAGNILFCPTLTSTLQSG